MCGLHFSLSTRKIAESLQPTHPVYKDIVSLLAAGYPFYLSPSFAEYESAWRGGGKQG